MNATSVISEAPLHRALVSMLRQLQDDDSDSVLIENNGVVFIWCKLALKRGSG